MTPKESIEIVDALIKKFIPGLKPEEHGKLLQSFLKDIDETAEKTPILSTDKATLILHVEKLIDEKLLENEFKKTTDLYIRNATDREKEDLKNEVKKDMEKMQKKGMDFKQNPKALQVMMKLLVLKHSISREFNNKHPGFTQKLKVDPTIEIQNNISKLKMEFMRLIKELENSDPKLVLELKKIMKDVILEMDKKISLEQDPQKELLKLFTLIMTLSATEFKNLPPEDKVTIVTQGSKSGLYAITPRNDVDMPPSIVVFPETPAANEMKNPLLKSPFDISQGPVPKGHESSGKS